MRSWTSPFFCWIGFGVVLGALLGIAFGKGDVRAPLLLGTIGGVLGLFGALIVAAGFRRASKNRPLSIVPAFVGQRMGAGCGGFLGVRGGLGRLMISWLNPDLPARDFEAIFGAIGGVFLGACFGACLSAALFRVLVQRRLSN